MNVEENRAYEHLTTYIAFDTVVDCCWNARTVKTGTAKFSIYFLRRYFLAMNFYASFSTGDTFEQVEQDFLVFYILSFSAQQKTINLRYCCRRPTDKCTSSSLMSMLFFWTLTIYTFFRDLTGFCLIFFLFHCNGRSEIREIISVFSFCRTILATPLFAFLHGTMSEDTTERTNFIVFIT